MSDLALEERAPEERRAPERFNWVTSIPFMLVHLSPLLIFVDRGDHDRRRAVRRSRTSAGCSSSRPGYHRYFSHRSYRLNRFWQFVFAFAGLTCAQKGPLWWAGHHRNHHKFSDTRRDIHSPRDGFWWSHVGWILCDKYGETPIAEIKDFAQVPRVALARQAQLGRPLGARRLLLSDRRVERTRRRLLLLDGAAVALDVPRQLARPRVRPAPLRHRRHEPQLAPDRDRHGRRGLAQQPPPLPELGAAGLPVVAARHDVLRPVGALAGSESCAICGPCPGV